MSDYNEQVAPEEEEREITAELNPLDLQREWDKLAQRASRVHTIIKMGARTDLGRVRENNEDKFDFFEPEEDATVTNKGALYAVADGMGGHAAGQIASEIALKTVIRSYYGDPSPEIESSLRRAVRDANSLIHEASQIIVERSGMGTTLTGVVVRADEVYFVQVGDSRGYLIRDGRVRQVTEDHSWVAEQVKRGALTEEDAKTSPFRNVITRSLGNQATVEPDVYADTLKPGDRIVLCSDGLSGNLSAEDIRDIVGTKAPSQAALDLVDTANDRGGHDNITAVVLVVKDVVYEDESERPADEPEAEPQPEPEDEPRKKGLFGFLRG